MKILKCICGYTARSLAPHTRRCKQWLEWKQLVIDDPNTAQTIKRFGLKGAAKKLGMNLNTVEDWFFADGSVKVSNEIGKANKKASVCKTDAVVEFTAEQILRALRTMIEQHDILLKQIAEIPGLQAEISNLQIALGKEQRAVKRMSDEKMLPFRVRIENEAIVQSKQ